MPTLWSLASRRSTDYLLSTTFLFFKGVQTGKLPKAGLLDGKKLSFHKSTASIFWEGSFLAPWKLSVCPKRTIAGDLRTPSFWGNSKVFRWFCLKYSSCMESCIHFVLQLCPRGPRGHVVHFQGWIKCCEITMFHDFCWLNLNCPAFIVGQILISFW